MDVGETVMKWLLISTDTDVQQQWHMWPTSAAVIRSDLVSVGELLELDQQGVLCLGPDRLQQLGFTGLKPLLKQALETAWRVVVFSWDIENPATQRLYELGVHDVVLWTPDATHNFAHFCSLLQRPFAKRPSIEQSEATILCHTGIVSWIFDPSRWAFTFISSNIDKVLGYTVDHWYSKNFSFKLVHPDDLARVDLFFRQVVNTPGIHEIRNRMLASGGRVVWIKTLINVEASSLNVTPMMTGVLFDVSEDQRFVIDSTQRLEYERNELEQHLNHAPLAVLKANANLEVMSWSAGAEMILGYSTDDVLGRHWGSLGLIHPDDESRVIEELLPLMNGLVRYQEVRNRNMHKDGRVVHMHWVNSCLRNPDGTLQSVLSMGRDIGPEIALEASRTQQAKMDALLTLSSGIAHDFNNLLTPIMLNAEMLEVSNQYSETEIREKAAVIKRSALRAREINTGLAQLNKPLAARLRSITTRDLVSELELACRGVLRQHSLHLDLNNAPTSFMGDEGLLLQALVNLLTNAAHAMEGKVGTIALSIVVNHATEQLLISVKDQGCGIALASQQDIFLPFFTTKRSGKGTGLGLAMAQRICEAHAGRIDLRSVPEQGAEFTLWLPFKAGEGQGSNEKATVTASHSLTIAIVDDEVAVLDSLRALLTARGHQCTMFTNARSALLELVNNSSKYDLLISDQMMPEQTGVELALSLEVACISLPIVLITGTVAQLERLGRLPSNIKAILEKPITRSELERCFEKVLV
jgi:PAS domain S-box-containing protein